MCKFCEKCKPLIEIRNINLGLLGSMAIEVNIEYKDNGKPFLQSSLYFPDEINSYETDIKYCPMCGKRLTNKE